MAFFKQAKESLFAKLLDDANVIVIYLDIQGNISICNKKIEHITGKAREEIIGRQWLSVLYHNDNAIKGQMFRAVMDDSLTYRRPNNFEGVVIDSHNLERYICWSISPILSDSGKLQGTLLVGNDLTEQRERKASYEKIDETLRNIFSGIKEYALYVVNLNGNITYYGVGSEIMFGWRKDEIIFKPVAMLHTPADAQSKLPEIFRKLKAAGEFEEELELVKKDKETFPVILTASPFLDNESKLIGYIFIAKDITERRKLEYQIFQAEKLAAIGQLTAGMAHEINNPLFVISGRLEMLLEQKELTHELREELDIINGQADRIRKLVERMLKFARKAPKRMERFNINEAIENVLPFISYHKQPGAYIEIEKVFSAQPLFVKGDLNQLQEVFVNLMLNACQAMPKGGKLTIETQGSEDNFALAKIIDTGSGIRAENMKNIFMPFFSTKKSGTGLGLPICYNIIKNHNGTIDVESRTGVNSGSVFTIKLPLVTE